MPWTWRPRIVERPLVQEFSDASLELRKTDARRAAHAGPPDDRPPLPAQALGRRTIPPTFPRAGGGIEQAAEPLEKRHGLVKTRRIGLGPSQDLPFVIQPVEIHHPQGLLNELSLQGAG
jgi:hypothetical protein